MEALRLLEDQWRQRLDDALAAAKNDHSALKAMVAPLRTHALNVGVSLSHRRGSCFATHLHAFLNQLEDAAAEKARLHAELAAAQSGVADGQSAWATGTGGGETARLHQLALNSPGWTRCT